ncbi:secondary thiamine-phosphate synthase enzyme YjbQ [Oleiharenicola lentus]|uniref:secondary thiamine-phosphate synthase enzyme YjbQ n=1 Tax=Oleiharenicola lentus TaxID=2508720 RepID=UPI003F667FDE
MSVTQTTLTIRTQGQGPYEITAALRRELAKTNFKTGVVTVFCRHTSCSLVTMENADPSAWNDLEAWMNRLVPERDALFTHTLEGGDDMPAHIKAVLTRTSETVPFAQGELLLGTWQGVFLWEHRHAPHSRSIVLTFIGD